MLSNNGLCLRTAAQYVLLFLDNSNQFHALTLAAFSYVLLDYPISNIFLSYQLQPTKPRCYTMSWLLKTQQHANNSDLPWSTL